MKFTTSTNPFIFNEIECKSFWNFHQGRIKWGRLGVIMPPIFCMWFISNFDQKLCNFGAFYEKKVLLLSLDRTHRLRDIWVWMAQTWTRTGRSSNIQYSISSQQYTRCHFGWCHKIENFFAHFSNLLSVLSDFLEKRYRRKFVFHALTSSNLQDERFDAESYQ